MNWHWIVAKRFLGKWYHGPFGPCAVSHSLGSTGEFAKQCRESTPMSSAHSNPVGWNIKRFIRCVALPWWIRSFRLLINCPIFDIPNVTLKIGTFSYLLAESKESNSENLAGETARAKYPRIPKKWGKLYNMPHLHKRPGENAKILSFGHGVGIICQGVYYAKAVSLTFEWRWIPPPPLYVITQSFSNTFTFTLR